MLSVTGVTTIKATSRSKRIRAASCHPLNEDLDGRRLVSESITYASITDFKSQPGRAFENDSGSCQEVSRRTTSKSHDAECVSKRQSRFHNVYGTFFSPRYLRSSAWLDGQAAFRLARLFLRQLH
jgi:hypothetical protein